MQKKPAPAENDDQIKLKPLFGMRPGIYLTILYSFSILMIFFFLLVFPGLKYPRAALVANTEPAGAAIRVNDVYMGLAGSRIIIPKGTYTIEAVMPGFNSQKEVHVIPSRAFGSLFSPRIYKIDFNLKTSDSAAAFAHHAGEFAEWTFMGEPTPSWQIPLVLSEGAYRVGNYQNEKHQEILKASARFAETEAALRDLIRAKALLDNGGNAPSPAALLGSIKDTLTFLSQTPDSAYRLLQLLPESAEKILNSAWYYRNTIKHFELLSVSIQRRINITELSFVDISSEKNFMISETPVPSLLFEEFLNENPQWREHKTDYVPDEILINPLEPFKENAVTGITWYAAEAFCKWLTNRLPQFMSNMEARLPSEDEWYTASFVIDNLRYPGWEWCSDYYAPFSRIKASAEAIEAVGSPERLLRGKALSSEETRASLPPEISSPVVTFRPVIREKE
ncbi:MAG: SUMF1/EgtB/PvdO family nonheme iron enzyme [Treponema sp.]|nr:SUMF1/EgtB/PvdO family nonheme iron enzyme [Treponema sp.]